MGPWQAMRQHWPEYLMEAFGLGAFMVAAGVAVFILEANGSPLRMWIRDDVMRRVIIGIAMGGTAVGIIYSPWGQQSGAHINPAVTLTFLRLGKIKPWDALFYILAQFAGGILGVVLVRLLLGKYFALAPVSYVVTVPGQAGTVAAFLAEFLISLGLMLTILVFMNSARLARFTGVAAGVLIVVYIIVESPLSGMSMNPARTFASAVPADDWYGWWIYYTAPILGMLLAVDTYRLFRRRTTHMCAKLHHPMHRRCVHCGYVPAHNEQPQGDS